MADNILTILALAVAFTLISPNTSLLLSVLKTEDFDERNSDFPLE